MEAVCPKCQERNRPVARFCAQCGLPLKGPDGEQLVPGQVPHPEPLEPPEGFEPCADAVNIHFRWESAWGGAMLAGTESLAVILFNGGFCLRDVELRVHGEDGHGKELFVTNPIAQSLPRGEEVAVEVPSYEVPNPVHRLNVSLTRAEFAPES